MNPTERDFVTADMRGLKAPLEALARQQRRSVSDLVRVAVADRWGLSAPTPEEVEPAGKGVRPSTIKLSIRLTRSEARALDVRARATGLARCAFVAGLVADVAVLKGGGRPADHLAALVASSAELATLCRYIAHLCELLKSAEWMAAREYRETLDTLVADVRLHLRLASNEFSALKPRSRPSRLTGERNAT
jgi:hypothetical protein